MKAMFYLGHPAHFHMLKNVFPVLNERGIETHILIKKKDVLETLLKASGFTYTNIQPEGRKSTTFGIIKGLAERDWEIFKWCRKNKPDVLVGTSVEITHVGKLLGITSIILNEDDADQVPRFAKLGYPFMTRLLAPVSCRVGKWGHKTTQYEGYHELAYLHPDHFQFDPAIKTKFGLAEKYFILRFSGLDAHHDDGKTGINDELALSIISILLPHGSVYITSERPLRPDLDKYRMPVPPEHIHQVMAGASMFIGDSQTMAAEAAVLGVPSVRFNDFVGKLGYLNELQDLGLTRGVETDKEDLLIEVIKEYLNLPDGEMQRRKETMLAQKINVAEFFADVITEEAKRT